MGKTPERLYIQLADQVADDDTLVNESVNEQIKEKAASLPPGTWFQVWYPSDSEHTYDVLRVVDGEIDNAPLTVTVRDSEGDSE